MNDNNLDLFILIVLAVITIASILHDLLEYLSSGFYRSRRFFRLSDKGPSLQSAKEISMDYFYAVNEVEESTWANMYFIE